MFPFYVSQKCLGCGHPSLQFYTESCPEQQALTIGLSSPATALLCAGLCFLMFSVSIFTSVTLHLHCFMFLKCLGTARHRRPAEASTWRAVLQHLATPSALLHVRPEGVAFSARLTRVQKASRGVMDLAEGGVTAEHVWIFNGCVLWCQSG